MLRSRLLPLTTALALAFGPSVLAQSQAINGTIEGVLTDSTGAVLPGSTVTVTNDETGAQRVVVTDSDGSYRALLLPLGTYRVRAELAGFRTVERAGVSLSAGQTARIDIRLDVGGVDDVISVVAEAPVTDPARVDLGRTITRNEIENLPLVARNPYNFALLQPGVTGYENEELGATRINANGSQMRTNYQIDGSSATQKNRAGLRMFQPSEVMIEEVQVVTNGFAPEFGQTTGMVYNAVTPSGTNDFRGQAGYRFRRSFMSARSPLLAPTAEKPETSVDDVTAALGGPVLRDRWHFYVGYEWLENDLGANRPIVVSEETARALNLSPIAIQGGAIPAVQRVNMLIAKTDAQLGPSHRMTLRWSLFENSTPENIGSTADGIPNTRESSVDFEDRMDNAQLQLVSTLGTNMLNELRVAYGRRQTARVASEVAGPGPQVEIPGVARFGGPDFPTDQPRFVQEFYQVVDNFSWFQGRHNFKVGFDLQLIDDDRAFDLTPVFRFDSIDDYLSARSGADPFAYSQLTQRVGDPNVDLDQRYLSVFVQDDFRLSSTLKLIYGLRYDLFMPPDGDPSAPALETRSFGTDKNNLAPRLGLAWALDPRAETVLRASTGLVYEPPLGRIYEDALSAAGTSRLLTASVSPGDAGAPAFPGTLLSLPPGTSPSSSIVTVNPDYANQYAWMSHVQLERRLTDDMSVSVGYVNSLGRDMPLLLSANFLPSGERLPDGRAIFDRNLRLRPEFSLVRETRSTGRSSYNALNLQVQKRMSHGYQLQASYTWSKAQDHGLGGDMVVGSIDREGLSDPLDQERDFGPTAWDTRHTFVLSAVIAPVVEGVDWWSAVLNHNQIGIVVQANSGLPYNIRSNVDLNDDGFTNDRPNFVGRNSGTLGSVFTVDLRYSRLIQVREGIRLELFADAKNLFNRANVRDNNEVVRTDAAGVPLDPVSASSFPVTSYFEPRQIQLGAKLTF